MLNHPLYRHIFPLHVWTRFMTNDVNQIHILDIYIYICTTFRHHVFDTLSKSNIKPGPFWTSRNDGNLVTFTSQSGPGAWSTFTSHCFVFFGTPVLLPSRCLGSPKAALQVSDKAIYKGFISFFEGWYRLKRAEWLNFPSFFIGNPFLE